jgi:hypothetical protein
MKGDSYNSSEDEFGIEKEIMPSKNIIKGRKGRVLSEDSAKILADKIRDEQWSTQKIKALWKRDPLFAKWWEKNIDTQPDEQRYYPSKFRGEYGEGK